MLRNFAKLRWQLCPLRCGFPLCSARCAAGELHRVECSVLEQADFEAEIEDFEVEDDHYAAIMPIRWPQCVDTV